MARGAVSRPARVTAIPLGRSSPTASSNQPGRHPGDGSKAGDSLPSPLFGFAPGGACHALGVAVEAVRSYRTLSPLPGQARRFAFCGAFPGVAPAGRYPAPCLRGARTFLCMSQRPSSRLAHLRDRERGREGQGAAIRRPRAGGRRLLSPITGTDAAAPRLSRGRGRA